MYKIIALGKQDAWYPDRKRIIGLVGKFEEAENKGEYKGGYFTPNKDNFPGDILVQTNGFYFYQVKVEKV